MGKDVAWLVLTLQPPQPLSRASMGKDVAWLVLTLCKRLRIAVTTSLCLLVQLKPNWFWVLSGFPAELLRFLQISRMVFL